MFAAAAGAAIRAAALAAILRHLVNSSSPQESPGAAAGGRLTLWFRLLVILCLVQFALLIVVSRLCFTRSSPGIIARPPSSADTNREPFFPGHPGPWGELEYAKINIEPTAEFVEAEEQTLTATHWFFEKLSPEQAAGLCREAGFTPPQLDELNQHSTWTTEPVGSSVVPSSDLVFSLTAETRARLYSTLAQNARNDLQVWPFVYRQGGFDEWFANSGLSAATLALVKQVLYQRGVALCVSDAPALCARITDLPERHRLIKTLARTSSLLMKVRIHPETDVSALTAYWGRGWHVKDIEPLLASLTKVPGSITLDIAHLLPPFARKRLNCYPMPLEPGQRPPDCYWTAWNFFNDPPDDRYFDDAVWRQELQQNYELVEQPTFGDLIFLTRPDGIPIHAAVFVADDVLFTKNGANLRQPWKLMKMEDVLARYPEDFPLRVAAFRLKHPGN